MHSNDKEIRLVGSGLVEVTVQECSLGMNSGGSIIRRCYQKCVSDVLVIPMTTSGT